MSHDFAATASSRRLCSHALLSTAWIAVFASLSSPICPAQDLSVLTRTSIHQPQTGKWQPLSRSLTLFHGGKVYDHVEEVGEVVIYEPTESQFVILSLNGTRTATRVRYEELIRFLEMNRQQVSRYTEELRSSPRRDTANVVPALVFQLDPKFDEAFDPSTGRVRLSSQFVTYQAETVALDRPGIVDEYLEWADWMARLNYALHPQAITPESRLELNRRLRSHGRLPTQVDLLLSMEGETRLRAEHTFEWSLRSLDRDYIAKWEKARNAPDVRWIDLRERVVAANNKNGR